MEKTALLCALLALAPATAAGLKVRPDRPRILLSNGTGPGTSLSTFRERCRSDDAYRGRCQAALSSSGGLWPAAGRAAAFLVNGDPARCTEAYAMAQSVGADSPGSPDPHSFISNNGRAMLQLAAVRDWCDPALSASQKSWLEGRMVQRADWYLANPPPDVFHNDMNNAWSAVALAGLALAGGDQDAKAQSYLAAADRQFKQVILPALAHAGDYWHEGFVYVQPALGSLVWHALAWTVATDEDLFAWARSNASDLFEGYLAFHAYLLRPDHRYAYFGDTTDSKQSMELFSRWLVDALTLGTGSLLGQGLSMEIREHSRKGYDYAGADAWALALLYDASREGQALPRAALPTARRLGRGAADVAVLRSGWGPTDTFVYFACGDALGAHQRLESGSFQIFRRNLLTVPSGYYDAFDSDHWLNYYSQHSVHANTLAVHMPGEFFPTLQSLADRSRNVNDGGQRTLRRDERGRSFPNPDLPTWLARKRAPPFVETGDLEVFEHAGRHDYLACDVTAAYASPGFATNGNPEKVREVTRQLVFLRPELIVLFDRVEAVQTSFEKRFLLHTPATPRIAGSGFTAANGLGRLIGQTLLPAPALLRVVEDFQVEGVAHRPSVLGAESGGPRLEVVPVQPKERDYFLHLLVAADYTRTVGPATVVEQDEAEVRLALVDGETAWELSFAKRGPMAGHLAIRAKNGELLWNQKLGATAPPPPDAGSPGPDASAGPDTLADGGSDAATDAGPEDVGSEDAGPGDTGAPDADEGGLFDAGSPAGEPGPTALPPAAREPEGCGCGGGGAKISALGLAGLLAIRRRRGRPGPTGRCRRDRQVLG